MFDDLLIGVTSFFREPKTFEALEEKVFPELVKNRGANESIRVWAPGCSTGEEVYSIAIAIQEFLEEKAKPEIRVQIFGTDANEKNIDKARQGIYPKTIEENISENKLKRFFSTKWKLPNNQTNPRHVHIRKTGHNKRSTLLQPRPNNVPQCFDLL